MPVAFFDADSTLRVSAMGKPSPANHPEDIIILPNIIPKLIDLAKSGYILTIVSNQGGISHGYSTVEKTDKTMAATVEMISRLGVNFNFFDYADEYNEYRKPNIGMALLIEKKLNKQDIEIDWNNSFMVGDAAWKKGKDKQPNGQPGSDHSNSDRLFAENIAKIHTGFKFFHPSDFFDWKSKYSVNGFPNAKVLNKVLHNL